MASALFYQHVRVLLGVVDPLVLQALRGTMYHLGCRDMAYTASVSELRGLIATTTPDLLFMDTNLGDDAFRSIVHIRHGELGSNPFVPIIMVTTHATHENVQAVVDTGADDLLPYPWNTGYLDQRLEKLIQERRPFVVTSDYIGPDRRAEPRADRQPVEPVVVPNPLRAKALDRKSDHDLQQEIKASAAIINADKIRRLSELVVRLVNELDQRESEGEIMSSLSEACLDKLVASTAAILKRAPGTSYAPAMVGCRTLHIKARKAREEMQSGVAPTAKTLRSTLIRFIREFQVDPAVVSVGLPEHLRKRLPSLQLRSDVS